MRLTGKAKEQFEDWFWGNVPEQSDYKFTLNYEDSCYETVEFYSLPESMQWGVIQDWADSMRIDVKVEPSKDYRMFWFEMFDNGVHVSNSFIFKTRQEARNAAIDKLNELINK